MSICNVCGKDGEPYKGYTQCRTCYNARRAANHVSDPRKVMLQAARSRARRLGLLCTITVDDIVIPETCPILGIRLVVKTGDKGPAQSSPSLDRVIPELGYVPGNVIVISVRANAMKRDGSLQELMQLGDWATVRLRSTGSEVASTS